jgi:pimeloyl-ACP methyl ester carboxylesterase
MTKHTETDAQSAATVAALESQARRVETPCGAGSMVWRIWGEGEPLVLAHGAQGGWTHWLRAIPALARGRMVIAADLPGHGSSAPPEAETHAGIAKALATGLTAILGEGKAADLAGFSFGGVMFAWFAALYPQAVRRLILIGTGGLGTPYGAINLRRISGLRGEARREALRANLLGLMLHHPASVDDLALHLLVTNARAARFTASAQLVVPDQLAKILPQIRTPIDAIWGEHDRPHPNPAAQEAVLRGIQPNVDFRVIADAGHWVMYERPEALIATLTDLLAAPPRTVL